MPLPTISDFKSHAQITEVWPALGGPKLRGNRGQAWWRGGDGYSVALDPRRGLWYDHARAEGGDVIALVRSVRGCGYREALEWLGIAPDKSSTPRDNQSRLEEWREYQRDLHWATWWATIAEALAEQALEDLPCCHPERHGLTQFLRAIRLGEASLVAEYCGWRRRNPQLTAAMTRVGRLHDADLQRRLAHWVAGGMR